MADRRIKVILEAQAANFQRGMDQAKRATEQFRGETEKMSKQDAMKTLAPSFTAFGAAVTAGLGAATKASMDWESAWTGVQKTVDGTPEQMAALEESLRSMAKELPATHEEIAGVAQAAGQLGVAVPDVEDFTRTMIDMGESTNMTADEAATTMARFANIMGTSHDEMDNLGSAIVDLGNNSATTESEIATMGQRLAGAGNQAGMTEGEVMGIAAAMSSVGIEAESGGTAMSRTMKRITNAVDEGSDKLDTFAQLAGMSASEFKAAWEEDPAMALQSVIEGLGRAEENGQNVNSILETLGVTSMREADALLRLSSASDLMGESMERGNQAYEEATALSEEAAQRYETTASKIQMARNSIKDAAMQAGDVILPAVGGMADAVGGLADAFSELPQPAQTSLTVLGGFAGVAALAAGGFVTLAPRIVETKDALRTLGATGPRARRAIKGIGMAAGGAAPALLALSAALEMRESTREVGDSADELRVKLDELAISGEEAATLFDDFADEKEVERINRMSGEVGGLEEILGKIEGREFVPDWAAGLGNLKMYREQVDGLDGALQQMVDGGSTQQAVEQMASMAEESLASGRSLQSLKEQFPDYVESLREFATNNGIALESQELLKWAFEGTVPEAIKAKGGIDGVTNSAKQTGEGAEAAQESGQQLEEALGEVGVAANGVVEEMDKFLEQLFRAGILQQSAREANAAYEASLDAVDESIETMTASLAEDFRAKGHSEEAARALAEEQVQLGAALNDNKTDFDLTTEAGRTAQGAFHDIADSGRDAASAMAENGASQDDLQGKLKGTYDDLVASAQQFGLSEDAARELTREVLGIPEDADIESWMDDEAKQMAEETKREVDDLDGSTANTYTNHHETTHVRTIHTQGAFDAEKAGSRTAGGVTRQATGGAVRGPGSGTSDDIPAMLSNGEHVLTAREVEAMGGQQGVYAFRSQLTSGPTSMTPATGADVRAFATGGAVSGGGPSAQELAAAISESMSLGFTLVQQGVGGDAAYESVNEFNRAVARHRRGGRA